MGLGSWHLPAQCPSMPRPLELLPSVWNLHTHPHSAGDNLFSQLQAKMPLVLKQLKSFQFFLWGTSRAVRRVQAEFYLFDANVSVWIFFNFVLFYVSLQSRPFSPPIHSSSPPPIAPLARAESTSSISSTNSLSAATTPTVGKHTQHCCSFTFPNPPVIPEAFSFPRSFLGVGFLVSIRV